MSGEGRAGEAPPSAPESSEVGLCATCHHARVQESARGSRFWRCGLAEHDARFRRYPPLPVRRCAGYRPAPAGEGPQGAPTGHADAEEC